MRLRTWFLLLLGLFACWFLFIERAILAPFVSAAIFAYIFNPVVNFASKKLHLSRIIGILCVYTVLLIIMVATAIIVSQRVAIESLDLNKILAVTLDNASKQIYTLPGWLQPSIHDLLINLKRSRFLGLFKMPLYTQAISRIIGFFIFLFSGFYFLKDGETVFEKMLAMVPSKYKVDVDVLFRKINLVLGGYLRGQIFLVFLMSSFLYIALSILGMRFSLLVAIFSGIAEIVPVIGPITAGGVAVLVMLLTGANNFGLTPLSAGLVIIAIYFVLRQIEDYFIIPHVMHKITKLPAFVIFFAVVAGGHMAGVLGLILAVPITAVLRLFLEFTLEKVVNE